MSRRSLRRRLVLAILALAVLVGAGYVALLWSHLRGVEQELDTLSSYVNIGTGGLPSFADAQAGLTRLQGHLDALRTPASLGARLAGLPRWGDDLAALPALWVCASDATLAVSRLLAVLQPLEGAGSGEALLWRAYDQLSARADELAAIGVLAEQTAARRAQIADAGLEPALQKALARLDAVLPRLHAAAGLLHAAPALLGSERPQVYLLVAQNNDERRATGGFISGVAELSIDHGQAHLLRFLDSYAVDDLSQSHPPAPPALARYMGASYLVLRDANWSPDFPTSAQVIAGLYGLDQGVWLDGVIAIDIDALGAFLPALGELRVEGYATPVTAENFRALIQTYWEAPADAPSLSANASQWWAHRKDFMAGLLSSGLRRAIEAPQSVDGPTLLAGLRRALDERHIQAALFQPDAAEALRQAGWDGAQAPVAGDYLMAVDSNVGFNKVDPLIGRQISYRVWLESPPRAELTLSYRHNGKTALPLCVHEARYEDTYADLQNRCYWDYLRIYLPAGSQLGAIEGFDPRTLEEPVSEGDKLVVAGLLVLAPGEQRNVRLSYTLPAGVFDGVRYRLDVQKPAGSHSLPLSVRVEGDCLGAPQEWNIDLRLSRRLEAGCP